ncbi:MAG TPA: helix-turn-helix domain-containing protein [Thermoplasmata archaeon]|nr:helix-turn-helix domain-containing protein [Thermoplasmata archaeon]
MRRAQAVLHSAQGFSPPRIAAMLFMSPDWVRHILRRFDEDGFESLYARYRGGGEVKFDDEARVQLVHLALSRPRDLGLPYNEWSLAKLREEAGKRGIVASISLERLRQIQARRA